MKRSVFWILLICFILCVVVWTVYTPRSSSDLLRAVPSEAEIVILLDSPAAQINGVLENSFTASLIASGGIDLEEIKDLYHDKKGKLLLDILFGGQCTLSYLPANAFSHTDTWIFTDWLGHRATAIRTALNWKRPTSIHKFGSYKAYPVYGIQLPAPASSMSVRFTFVEGGIIGTVSADPHAIHRTINTYIQNNRAAEVLCDERLRDPHLQQAPIKGWAALEDHDESLRFALRAINTNELHLLLQMPVQQPISPLEPAQSITKTTPRLFGNLPQVLMRTSFHSIKQLADNYLPTAYRPAIDQAARYLDTAPITAALLGDEYSGRVMQMKFPTLVLSIPLAESTNRQHDVDQYIDDLNGTYKLGLVPEAIEVAGGRVVYALEGTGDNSYSERPSEERIAYTIIDNHFVLASGTPALLKLTARYDRDEAHQLTSETPGTDAINHVQSPSIGCIWIDLKSGAKSLRLAMIAYAFKLMQEDPANSDLARDWLTHAQAWTDSLEPMKYFVANLTQTNEILSIDMRLGHQD